VETSVGSYEALRKITFPTFEEYLSESRRVRAVAMPQKANQSAIACIAAANEEPVFFSGVEISFILGPGPTHAQIRAFCAQGYRYSRETAKLGDLNGRRAVAFCVANGDVEYGEIQPEVPVHWFMSPDIPAWKSRAVPTERIGQATSPVATDLGEETFKAIFDGPTVETVTALRDRRWWKLCLKSGTAEDARALYYRKSTDGDPRYEQLWDEIVAEEYQRADRRLEVAFIIGAARFVRLWSLALAACSLPAQSSQPDVEDAIDVLIAPAVDAVLTS
jgi:hypothetical protein